MYAYVGIAFVGGLCGAYFGSLKLNQNFLKYSFGQNWLYKSAQIYENEMIKDFSD